MANHPPIRGGVNGLAPQGSPNSIWEDASSGAVALWEDSSSGDIKIWETLSTITFFNLCEPLMSTVNATITTTIDVATSGYANADFTKHLFVDGESAPETVSLAETGTSTGLYNVTFTPTSTGLYTLLLYHTSTPEVKWVGTFRVDAADTTQTHLSHIRSILNRVEDALKKTRLKK